MTTKISEITYNEEPIEMEPCKKCGEMPGDELAETGSIAMNTYWAVCSGCGHEGPESSPANEAALLWNDEQNGSIV
jgi:hypothetical protein